MKKSAYLTTLTLMTLLLVTITAKANNFGATKVSTSECKGYSHTPTRSASVEEGEWIDYSVEKRDDGFYLHIVHENIYFNCAMVSAQCTATINNNVITMTEREVLGDVATNCICPYDLTYDVGPLQEGEYTIVIAFNGYKLAEFSVYIAESYHNRFNVEAYIAKVESALPALPENKIIYDLLGRRYATFPFPGIFIQNGKKILWKGK